MGGGTVGPLLPDSLGPSRGGAWNLSAGGGRAGGGAGWVEDGNAFSQVRQGILGLSLGFPDGSDLRFGITL